MPWASSTCATRASMPRSDRATPRPIPPEVQGCGRWLARAPAAGGPGSQKVQRRGRIATWPAMLRVTLASLLALSAFALSGCSADDPVAFDGSVEVGDDYFRPEKATLSA